MSDKKKKKSVLLTIVALLFMVVLIKSIFITKEFSLIDKEKVHYQQVLSVPSAELIELRTREFNTLNSYAVLDKDAKIYRIPVSRAIELMAEDSIKK
jgi:hypothetical protein